MSNKILRDIEVARQILEQGTSSSKLQSPLGDELRAERRETIELLIQRGKMRGSEMAPQTLREYLCKLLTSQVAAMSDDTVIEISRFYALTNPMACDLFEKTFGPIHP